MARSQDKGREVVKIHCEKLEGKEEEGWDEASQSEEVIGSKMGFRPDLDLFLQRHFLRLPGGVTHTVF